MSIYKNYEQSALILSVHFLLKSEVAVGFKPGSWSGKMEPHFAQKSGKVCKFMYEP